MNNIEKIKPSGIFTNYIYKAIPLAFDESMSYYETLCGLTAYLRDTVIPALNNNAESVIELQNLYKELKNYVDNYFNNLDVQTEINNKLDEMAETGKLTEIVTAYLEISGILAFNTINDMKESNNLVNGSFVETYGYNNLNDGLGAKYKIREVNNTDIIDNVNIIALNNQNLVAEFIKKVDIKYFNTINDLKNDSTLIENKIVKTLGFYEIGDGGESYYLIKSNLVANEQNIIELKNNLYAELYINNKTITTKQFGIIGDGNTDETEKLQNLFNYITDNTTVIVIGMIKVNPTLTLENKQSITITSNKGVIGYSTDTTIQNGLLINVLENYTTAYGINIINCKGIKLNSLLIKSTEEVNILPLNGIYGINLNGSPFTTIENCDIIGFFIGLYLSSENSSSALSKIINNNFALNNVGCWCSNFGDGYFENNYFNSSGWNAYGEDNTLNPYLNELNTRGRVHGKAFYIAGGGAIQIRGSKMEYLLQGIYANRTTHLLINNIIFDRCMRNAICFDSDTNWLNAYSDISNCTFLCCGADTIGGNRTDVNGSMIGIFRTNNINISNCSFMGGNDYYLNNLSNQNERWYGPKTVYIDVYGSRFINVVNCTFPDNIYTIRPRFSIVNASNLSAVQKYPMWIDNGYVTSGSNLEQTIVLYQPTNSLTFGHFNLGDRLLNPYNLNNGYRCSVEGSLGNVTNQTATVINQTITDGSLTIKGDMKTILINNYNGDELGVGDFININGVTDKKQIMELIWVGFSNHYYAKLNNACDVAVSNSTITKSAPQFETF